MAGAPAEKSLEILSQELTCSLCGGHYCSAKALQCCHYFCLGCLRDLARETAQLELHCPTCSLATRLPPDGVPGLPDVRFVDRLKELHARMAAIQRGEEDGAAKCELCSANFATFFCRQCADLVCGACAESHRLPGHCVSPLDQLKESGARAFPMKPPPPSTCSSCSETAVAMFCRDCSRLACDRCISAAHSDHRAEPVKKSASQTRRQLQQSLFPLRILGQQLTESLARIKNAERDVSSQGEDAEQTINSFFDRTISLLEKERESLLVRAAGLVEEKLGALKQQEVEVTQASSEVQSVVEFSKQSVELVSDEEVLALHDDLQNRIQEECARHEGCSEIEPCETANIAVQMTGAEEFVRLCRERARVYLFPSNANSLIHRAEVGQETTHCVMESCDPLFTKHLASYTATLVSVVDDSTIEGRVTPVGRGLYEVRYTPRVRGRHRLWVKRDGETISDTPFQVLATIPPTQLGKPIHCMESLKHPYSVAFDSKNQLYVTQSGGDKIQKFRRRGDKVASDVFTTSHQMKAPTGMAIDSDGFSYLVNISTHTLSKFDREGELVCEVGSEGSERDELNHPSGVAVVGERVYVCDRNNDRIKVYSKDLRLLEVFGSHGNGDGEMNWPYDIASDNSGLIYIADSDNHRVQVFDKSGRFLRSLGTPSNGAGSLKRPTGVCVGQGGHLYVTEYANHRVSVFTRDGVYVGSFGSCGSGVGQFCYPVGITIDRDGFVYVCDQGNNRVQVF